MSQIKHIDVNKNTTINCIEIL